MHPAVSTSRTTVPVKDNEWRLSIEHHPTDTLGEIGSASAIRTIRIYLGHLVSAMLLISE